MDSAFEPLDHVRLPDDDDRFDLQAVPDGGAAAPNKHYRFGAPSRRWAYHDRSGDLLGYVCRFDLEEGKKKFRPLFLGPLEGQTRLALESAGNTEAALQSPRHPGSAGSDRAGYRG